MEDIETARALRLAPRLAASLKRHQACQIESSALDLRSRLHPPIRRRFLGECESKARAIRLAKQGLKCHYNGIITREALGKWRDPKTARRPGH